MALPLPSQSVSSQHQESQEAGTEAGRQASKQAGRQVDSTEAATPGLEGSMIIGLSRMAPPASAVSDSRQPASQQATNSQPTGRAGITAAVAVAVELCSRRGGAGPRDPRAAVRPEGSNRPARALKSFRHCPALRLSWLLCSALLCSACPAVSAMLLLAAVAVTGCLTGGGGGGRDRGSKKQGERREKHKQ